MKNIFLLFLALAFLTSCRSLDSRDVVSFNEKEFSKDPNISIKRTDREGGDYYIDKDHDGRIISFDCYSVLLYSIVKVCSDAPMFVKGVENLPEGFFDVRILNLPEHVSGAKPQSQSEIKQRLWCCLEKTFNLIIREEEVEMQGYELIIPAQLRNGFAKSNGDPEDGSESSGSYSFHHYSFSQFAAWLRLELGVPIRVTYANTNDDNGQQYDFTIKHQSGHCGMISDEELRGSRLELVNAIKDTGLSVKPITAKEKVIAIRRD